MGYGFWNSKKPGVAVFMAILLIFVMVGNVALPYADFLTPSENSHFVASASDIHSPSDAEKDSGEIELINDLEENAQDYELLASDSEAQPKEVAFFGVQDVGVQAGAYFDVLESVGAKLGETELDVAALEVKTEAGESVPFEAEGIIKVSGEVGSKYTVNYVAYSPDNSAVQDEQGALASASDAEEVQQDEQAELFAGLFGEFIEERGEDLLRAAASDIAPEASVLGGDSLRAALLDNEKLNIEEINAVTKELLLYPSETVETAAKVASLSLSTESALPLAMSSRSLTVMPMGNVGTVIVTNIRSSDKDRINFTTLARNGTIQYDGRPLVGLDQNISLQGSYIEMKVPIEHLSKRVINSRTGEIEGFKISADSKISRIEYSRETGADGKEYLVAKAVLKDIDRTAIQNILYTVKFENSRRVPEDYELLTSAKIYTPGGDELGASNTVDFKVMYEKPEVHKFSLTNLDWNNQADNYMMQYGGTSVNGIITDPRDVVFMYNMSTKQFGNSATDIPHIYRYRLQEQIELVDTLPTYYNHTLGVTVPATFISGDNPGWTAVAWDAFGNPTKVKYTVNSTSEDIVNGGADAELSKLKLRLRFPGLKVNEHTNGGYPTSIPLSTSVAATYIPYDEGSIEALNRKSHVDSLVFRIIQNESGGPGAVVKQRIGDKYSIDPGVVHLNQLPYQIYGRNVTAYPLKETVVTDYAADERTYYHSMEFYGKGASVGADGVKEIWGLDAAGVRSIKIYDRARDGALPASGSNDRRTIYLDTEARDEVLGYVAEVEAGTRTEASVPSATRRIHAVDVVYDSLIQPGERLHIKVMLGILDPYHLTKTPEFVSNSAKINGKYTGADGNDHNLLAPNGQEFSSTVSKQLVDIEQKIGMTKITGNSPSSTVGDAVTYRVTVDFRQMGKGNRYTNPKVIEVLPVGVKYAAIQIPSGNVLNARVEGTIEDYKGSGRQAVIIAMDNFKVEKLYQSSIVESARGYFQFNLTARITGDALRDRTGTSDSSLNRAYFTADGLYPLSSSIKPIEAGKTFVPDLYDIDNNAATTTVIGADSPTILNTQGEIRAYKEIRAENGTWLRGELQTNYGERFDYSFVVRNSGMGDIGNTANEGLIIYDIFPYEGDEKYTGQGSGSRGSQFRNVLAGAVQAPVGFEVKYSTTNPPELDPGQVSMNMQWTTVLPADLSTVTAIMIKQENGHVIPDNSITRFVIPMKAPDVPAGGYYTTEKRAINDFVISYDLGSIFGLSNTVSNVLTKSIKVEKQWEGGSERPTVRIQLKQNGVNYSSAKYPSGVIELSAATNWKGSFEALPFKAADGTAYTYTIEELGVGSGDLAGYVASITGNDTRGFVVKNSYIVSPPTGLVRNNIPFLLLSSMGVFSLFALWILRRRNA